MIVSNKNDHPELAIAEKMVGKSIVETHEFLNEESLSALPSSISKQDFLIVMKYIAQKTEIEMRLLPYRNIFFHDNNV